MYRSKQRLIAALLGLAPAMAWAGDAATAWPDSPEAWVGQMLDAKRNGAAFKDPAAFAEWLNVISEPSFMTAMGAVAIDPATYPKVMASAIDPQAARNWAEFTNPQLYLRWMLASANPSYQKAIIQKMSDPAKMARWAETMQRPDAFVQMMKAMQQTAPMAWAGNMRVPGGDNQDWSRLPEDKGTARVARYRY